MKLFFTLLLVLNCVGLADPERPNVFDFSGIGKGMSLEVKEIGSGRKIERNWESDYGSYDRDFARGKTLEVHTRNITRQAYPDAAVDAFWLATKLDNKAPFLFYRDTKEVPGATMANTTMRMEMPELKSSVLNLAALGEKWVSGSKFGGWIVLIRAGAKVMEVRASSPSLVTMAKTPQVFTHMLEKLEPEKD